MSQPQTLIEALQRAAALAPTRGLIFLDREEREVSAEWRDVFARAAAVAGGLRARGIREGDTVVSVFPTGPRFFDAFFGTLLAGAVPVPLYPPARLGRLLEYQARTAAMITAVGARLVLTDSRTLPGLAETQERAKPEQGVVDVTLVTGPPCVRAGSPDDLALVQFSSGTTTDPKPAALTHRNVLANVRAIHDVVREAGADVVDHGVSWLPLYHDMGLIGCVFLALYHPGSLTLIPPDLFVARPALWLRALSRTRAPVSAAPNFAYALCTERIRDEDMAGVDLSGWHLALNGSEPVSAATLRRFVTRFSRWGLRAEALTPVYGLAEATLAVTFSDWRRPFRTARFDRAALADGRPVPAADGVELVSVGRPLAGMNVSAPIDRVGPIRARGPSVMRGYLGQPERTAATLVDGWLETGDLGFLHDGELYVCGRAKDVVILRGRNHAPSDIEQVVNDVPGVWTGGIAAVGYRPSDGDEERLLVFVEARHPKPDLARRCREAVLGALGLDPGLVVVLAPGTLPRTSSGKIRRGEALARWSVGALVDAIEPWMLAGELSGAAPPRGRGADGA